MALSRQFKHQVHLVLILFKRKILSGLSNFLLQLNNLVIIDPPINMPTPINYFAKYFNNDFFEKVAFYTNLYAVQNNNSNFNRQMLLK